jgi:predicted O-linked N-acetylglucosamine transferase (SPINDLY family)
MSVPAEAAARARELQAAEAEIRAGRAQEALARLAALEPSDPEVVFMVARAEEALGRHAAALERLLGLKARLARSTAPLEMQIGSVQARMGDLPAAAESMARAVALQPELPAAHKNLAATLTAAGRHEDARQALRRAVASVPHDATLWIRLAMFETRLGDSIAAVSCLEKAAATMPSSAAVWRDIGQAHAALWRWPEADRALVLAAALDPGAPETESLAALAKQELGDMQGALGALQRAQRRAPDDLAVVLADRLMLPQVYQDHADLARWRERYSQGVAALQQEASRWLPRAPDVFKLNRHNFLLAYQGEDDKALQRGYSAFLAMLAGHAQPQLRAPRPVRFDGSRRLRVGFASTVFRDCTAGRYFERWITRLDAARFERFVYHLGPLTDAFTQRIAGAAEHFSAAHESSLEVAQRIARDELDVLVHPEVGMASITYTLAALRLAPVQCAGWGHPVTTGSDAIDYYFTCGTMEPPDGEAHYVERLVPLPGIGVDYSMPAPVAPATRAELGLPENRRLYMCAQSLFKVHPDMDALLADIVAADDQATLVFFQAGAAMVTDTLAARLQRAMGARGVAPRGQLRFLPRMESAQFRRALALADVVVDTPRWSGGNTSIDAFAVGAPVVTLPGRFMRGRQTAGMLELMGIPELIAATPADYVRIAPVVARDRERNAQLRSAILERREVLFDRPEPVAALSEALLRLGAGGR